MRPGRRDEASLPPARATRWSSPASRPSPETGMKDEFREVTILGGGPVGLFGAFYAGLRGVSSRIVDSLPELGGQLMALYPEKYIYDVGGFPKILAKDFVARMKAQALQFDPDVVLDEEILRLEHVEEGFSLEGRRGKYPTRSLVIAGGKGAFEPMKLKVPGYEELLGKGVHYAVKDPEAYRGKRVLIVGGGDSALDWAIMLKDRAERLMLVHRRATFRAHETTVAALDAACDDGEMELRTFHEVREILGKGKVEGATIFDNRSGEEFRLELDAVLTFLGFRPDLGPIKEWGLDFSKNRILVNQLMETNIPGIYAAGDVTAYDGKLDLIATGFGEAAVAVNNAVHHINPKARVNPGHSTHLKIFK